MKLKQTEIEETGSVVPVTSITPIMTSANQKPGVQLERTTTPIPVDSKDLIRKLASRKALVRTEAERQIKSMDVPTLLALMAEQKRLRKQRIIVFISVIFAMGIIVLPVLAFWMHTPVMMMFWSVMMPGLLVGAVAFTPVQKSIAVALAEKEDKNAVGELVAALAMQDQAVQQVIRPALTRLLPQLHSQHAPLLKKEDRTVLRQFMEGTLFGRFGQQRETQVEVDLLLAALKALEQVGDSSFLPVVTRWANGEKYGVNPGIRQAASACLPYLELCSTNRQVGEEMLRASAPDPALDARALLRPASDIDGASSENLLRPSEPEQPETRKIR